MPSRSNVADGTLDEFTVGTSVLKPSVSSAALASETATFPDGFGFATEGLVFTDLPPGVTVNGTGIVDNHFVVPEPGGLCAVLLTAAAALRRRRARH